MASQLERLTVVLNTPAAVDSSDSVQMRSGMRAACVCLASDLSTTFRIKIDGRVEHVRPDERRTCSARSLQWGWSGAERAQKTLPRLQEGVQVRESFDAHGGRAYMGRIVQLPKFPKHNSSTSKDCIMGAQEEFGNYGGRTISCAIMPPIEMPMM